MPSVHAEKISFSQNACHYHTSITRHTSTVDSVVQGFRALSRIYYDQGSIKALLRCYSDSVKVYGGARNLNLQLQRMFFVSQGHMSCIDDNRHYVVEPQHLTSFISLLVIYSRVMFDIDLFTQFNKSAV